MVDILTRTILNWISHFVWRTLAGALAVSDQLRSRGIQVDTTCKNCGMRPETICHALFTCPAAQDVWRAARLPMPPLGLSMNSVFLNLHHLVACTKSKDVPTKLKQSIPWILWHIWKARNGLIFDKIRLSPFQSWVKLRKMQRSGSQPISGSDEASWSGPWSTACYNLASSSPR